MPHLRAPRPAVHSDKNNDDRGAWRAEVRVAPGSIRRHAHQRFSDREPAAAFRNGTAIAPIAAPCARASRAFRRARNLRWPATANGRDWVLLNASPDLRQQIEQNPELAPSGDDPVRASPIKAVVVTNGDVDHVTGLLTLREAQPFTVYGSRRVLEVLSQNRIFNVLSPACVAREELPLDTPVALTGAGADLGLSVEAFPVAGKIALWLEDALKANFGSVEGDTLGLKITETASGKAFFYIPGCAAVDAALGRASARRGARLLRRHALA